RAAFTAAAVPTAATPQIACTVAAGHPFLVTWNYDASAATGTFTVTYPDRGKLTFGAPAKAIGGAAICALPARLEDGSGNAVTFSYGPLAALSTGTSTLMAVGSGFPLL